MTWHASSLLCRLRVLGLAAGVLLAAAGVAHAQSLTPAQKADVDRQIHDYLMNHPDVIMDALKAAQQASDTQAAAAAQTAIAARHAALYDDPDSPVGGNPHGDVTIIEFFDYRCPYCKEVEPALETLLKEDRNLRIVYKEFPVLGPASVFASQVALAARQQGKYIEFHRRMMAQKGTIDDGVVLHTAQAVGIDPSRLKHDLESPKIAKIIKNDYALADALNIQGTPAFIVGGKLLPGAVDIDTLRRVVKEARAGG